MAGREKYESPVNEKKISDTATVSFNSLKRRSISLACVPFLLSAELDTIRFAGKISELRMEITWPIYSMQESFVEQ